LQEFRPLNAAGGRHGAASLPNQIDTLPLALVKVRIFRDLFATIALIEQEETEQTEEIENLCYLCFLLFKSKSLALMPQLHLFCRARKGQSWISVNHNILTMRGRFQNVLQKFRVMGSAPRELWIIYAAYILENLAYKLGSAAVLPLWLSSDLGYNDVKAGAMIATWSAIMTLVTVLVGSLSDALGVRKTFLLAFWTCLVARSVMALTTAKWLVLPFGLYLDAVGIALMIPVMTVACKRYTNAAQRSVAFSLYYALMNLGYAIGDKIFDVLRGAHGLGELGHWTLPGLGLELSTYRVLILLGVGFTVPGLILVWLFVREGVEMTETGVKITPRNVAVNTGVNPMVALWRSCRGTAVTTGTIFKSLWQRPAFYRFLIFMTIVVGVRMIFYQLAYTFPKYGIRELGSGAPFAHLSGMLNSLLVVVLVPICGVLTQKFSAYRMVTIGSLVSALSVFFIALPPAWFQPVADGWLGNLVVHHWLSVPGPVNPLYISIFFFVVVLSIGEALWSPRLYEYAAAVAPKGQEASYMALSLLPMFVAKFVVGGISGWLLSVFCPAEGPRRSEVMWFIIGCMALITPVGTYLFRKQIQVHEEGRDEPVTGTKSVA
jgi:MFS family permease